MLHKLEPVSVDALSDIRCSFLLGEHRSAQYTKTILVVRFEGVYRYGSSGSSDAAFIGAMGRAGVCALLATEAAKRGRRWMQGIVHSRAIFDPPPRSSAYSFWRPTQLPPVHASYSAAVTPPAVSQGDSFAQQPPDSVKYRESSQLPPQQMAVHPDGTCGILSSSCFGPL